MIPHQGEAVQLLHNTTKLFVAQGPAPPQRMHSSIEQPFALHDVPNPWHNCLIHDGINDIPVLLPHH
jgi:hypothetical protein